MCKNKSLQPNKPLIKLNTMKKVTLLFVAILTIASITLTAQVAINTDGTPPDGSAMLEVNSSSLGFLVPRMTSAERDAISFFRWFSNL